MRIFKGDSTAIGAAVAAVLAFLLTFDQFDLTQEKVGLIMAVSTAVIGLLTSYVTKRTVLGLVMAALNAVAALLVGFDLDFLTVDQTGALLAGIPVLFGLFHWSSTSPADVSSFSLDA